MPMQYNNFCECEIFSHTENIKREINDYTKESSLTEQKTNYSQLVRMCVCVCCYWCRCLCRVCELIHPTPAMIPISI